MEHFSEAVSHAVEAGKEAFVKRFFCGSTINVSKLKSKEANLDKQEPALPLKSQESSSSVATDKPVIIKNYGTLYLGSDYQRSPVSSPFKLNDRENTEYSSFNAKLDRLADQSNKISERSTACFERITDKLEDMTSQSEQVSARMDDLVIGNNKIFNHLESSVSRERNRNDDQDHQIKNLSDRVAAIEGNYIPKASLERLAVTHPDLPLSEARKMLEDQERMRMATRNSAFSSTQTANTSIPDRLVRGGSASLSMRINQSIASVGSKNDLIIAQKTSYLNGEILIFFYIFLTGSWISKRLKSLFNE